MNKDIPEQRQPVWRLSRHSLMFIGFVAIAGFFLLTEHRAHALGFLPFLLLALCPLMHRFGHGHSDHATGTQHDPAPPEPRP